MVDPRGALSLTNHNLTEASKLQRNNQTAQAGSIEHMKAMKKNINKGKSDGICSAALDMTSQMMYGKNLLQCSYCGKEASKNIKMKQCSRCKIAMYCSQEHQLKHWKQGKFYEFN